MKIFEAPKMTVARFNETDIVTTSGITAGTVLENQYAAETGIADTHKTTWETMSDVLKLTY